VLTWKRKDDGAGYRHPLGCDQFIVLPRDAPFLLVEVNCPADGGTGAALVKGFEHTTLMTHLDITRFGDVLEFNQRVG